MENLISSNRKRAQKERSLEDYNRDERWTRTFTVRSEPWPLFEHWAHENNFHLTAIKGKKRVYCQGDNPTFYSVWIEVKQSELQLTITAWITVGWALRLLWGFLLPAELQLSPSGWKGVRKRRQACTQLNSLLDRFRQSAIAGSNGLHLADLDLSVIALALAGVLSLSVFIFMSTNVLLTRPLVTSHLLSNLGRPFGLMILSLSTLLAAQHFLVLKRLSDLKWIWSCCLLAITLQAGITLGLLSTTEKNLTSARFAQYCFQKKSLPQCQQVIEKLSPEQKKSIKETLELVQKELSLVK